MGLPMPAAGVQEIRVKPLPNVADLNELIGQAVERKGTWRRRASSRYSTERFRSNACCLVK